MQDKPLDPAAERLVAKVRRLMAISVLCTGLAVAAVLAVIGYRVFRGEGSAARPADVSVNLPKGAKVVATAVHEDRLVVTTDAGGVTEIHVFDVRTLQLRGRIRLQPEP
jgi:uncharacterized protein DUF6476